MDRVPCVTKAEYRGGYRNDAPRSKLRGITEHSFEDFSENRTEPRSKLRGMFKFM